MGQYSTTVQTNTVHVSEQCHQPVSTCSCNEVGSLLVSTCRDATSLVPRTWSGNEARHISNGQEVDIRQPQVVLSTGSNPGIPSSPPLPQTVFGNKHLCLPSLFILPTISPQPSLETNHSSSLPLCTPLHSSKPSLETNQPPLYKRQSYYK